MTHKNIKKLFNEIFSIITILFSVFLLPTHSFAHTDVHEQITHLSKKINSSSGSYTLYTERAHLNFEGGHLEAALRDLNTASKMGPKEPLYFEYANIYAAKKNSKKSLHYFNQYIAFDPQLPSAYLGRGRVFKRLGLMEQAIVDFKKSIDIDPQPHPGVVIKIADMLQGSKNGGIDASV
ncbi:MAG: tetratricopeptide repeat protein, partial [Burkholderiaceae bacterium]|nr:tetratricopeptide repeat protein [Burkholderiaceae bacterium]